MPEQRFEISQDREILDMIDSSLFRCGRSGLPGFEGSLPAVTAEGRARSRRAISGHTMLIRESAPKYYKQLTEALISHEACLFYVSPDFCVYGRYGNERLKEELRERNLRIGSDLSEDVIGTNAAALSARCAQGVWTVGEQNYAHALRPYAFYAFTVHGRYDRYVHILLAARLDRLNAETVSLFRLIDATESIFSAGLVTEDVLIKDTMFRRDYSEEKTENLLIIIGSSGQITYANDVFYTMFKTDYSAVINFPLTQVVPELSYALDGLREGAVTPYPRQLKFAALGPAEFYVSCTPMDRPTGGMVITAQRAQHAQEQHSQSGSAKYTFDDLVGVSERFKQLKRFAERIANTKCTVLIRGESGTGKELFAHAIHNASDRRSKPFVSVNCAAIPRDLIGSELFGYVGGAFTGASRHGAKGKFELADGGTLFLDEIAEMPPDMQSVLLRVLEDNAITRIGGSRPTPVDVRLIVATNQKLEESIKHGSFRLDLYYRLNIISLNMLPLRSRRDDISALTDFFIARFSKAHGKQVDGVSSEARGALLTYDWPGNVRELRNVIERGVVTCDGRVLELRHLPEEIVNIPDPNRPQQAPGSAAQETSSFREYRRETAERLMKEYAGNKSKVAKRMGIARTTLYRILSELEQEEQT